VNRGPVNPAAVLCWSTGMSKAPPDERKGPLTSVETRESNPGPPACKSPTTNRVPSSPAACKAGLATHRPRAYVCPATQIGCPVK